MSANRIPFRLIFVFCFFAVAFILIGIKMYEVQITRHEELYKKAKSRYTHKTSAANKRGEIYDHDGNLLVGNRFCTTIAFDPRVEKDPEKRKKIAHFLERELPDGMKGKSFQELYARLNTEFRYVKDKKTGEMIAKELGYVVLIRDVEYTLGESIREKAKNMHFSGLIFERSNRRTYPKKQLLANVLGYSNTAGNDVVAVTGLESAFREEMAPESDTLLGERTRDGASIRYTEWGTEKKGYDGANIYLTIREPIQAILEEELDKMMERVTPKTAYAIMVDPYTGDILAMAQRPTFDPNDRSNMDGNAYRNRISTDIFEPGSVIKPFVVAMALDHGVITEKTRIDTGFGPWGYAGRRLSDTHYIGTVTPARIIQHSSNIGTAMIAVRMGKEMLYDTLKTFHFGEKSGLPLSPESEGRLRPLNKWGKLSVSRVCIGYEMMVTPLQLVRAYSMLANGGHSLQLRLVDSIETNELGKKKQPYRIAEKSVFKNPKTSRMINTMMEAVTRPGGTASLAGVPGFSVAGKTGTAHKVTNGRYDMNKYSATFCGFVPAQNPRFVLLVTCEEPQGVARHGGSAAGPTFGAIAQRTLEYMGVKPDVPVEHWEQERVALQKAYRKERAGHEAERQSRLKSGKTTAPTGIVSR